MGYDDEILPANVAARNIFRSRLEMNTESVYYEESYKDISRVQREIEKFDFDPYGFIITNSPGPARWLKKEKKGNVQEERSRFTVLNGLARRKLSLWGQ